MRAVAVLLISLALTAGLGACNKPSDNAGQNPAATGDMSLGSPAAKVTVTEYASLGCPICARWNNTVFQDFKAKYIDTNKVHYVFREFLTGDAPVATAGFLLAHCVGKDKYFQIVDEVFRQEEPLLESDRGPEKRDALVRVAESAGLTEAQFDACVSNDAAITALNNKAEGYAKDDKIESTPTFDINGKIYTGFQSLADMDTAIAAAQAGAK
jgi:protein-disulfide isomerase